MCKLCDNIHETVSSLCFSQFFLLENLMISIHEVDSIAAVTMSNHSRNPSVEVSMIEWRGEYRVTVTSIPTIIMPQANIIGFEKKPFLITG